MTINSVIYVVIMLAILLAVRRWLRRWAGVGVGVMPSHGDADSEIRFYRIGSPGNNLSDSSHEINNATGLLSDGATTTEENKDVDSASMYGDSIMDLDISTGLVGIYTMPHDNSEF